MQSVEIVHNRVKNGIELYFKEPLSLKEADHLKQSGFEQAFQQPLKWWAKQHPAFIHFAEALKAAVLNQTPITDVLLQPSFAPSQENIDLNKFSFVTLKGDSFNPESYVIFDPYKVVAHAVATRFGNNKYGPQLKEVLVLPRKQKNLARTHLKNGYVITGQEELIPQEIDPETGLKYLDQRANIYGVYTRKTAEGYYEEVEIPFPKSLKFRASVSLAQGSDNQYRYGTNLENLTGSFAGHHFAPSVHDKAYTTREAALESALKYLYAHSDTPVPARKYLQQFALSKGVSAEPGDNPQDLQKTPKGHPGDNPQLPELPSDMSLSEWLRRLGFTHLFTAEDAFNKPMLVSDLHHRWLDAYAHFHKQYEEPAIQQIQDWRSELEGLQKDKTPTGKAASKELKERIDHKQEEVQRLKVRLEEENLRFQEAFLQLLRQKAEQIGFRIAQENERSSFDAEMAEGFFNERMAEAYYRQSIPQAAEALIRDFFRADPQTAHTPEPPPQPATEPKADPSGSDYLDLVVAHIHGMFSEGQRPTKGQIEKLGTQLQIPNRGLLWEAAELAWLLWYRMIYRQNSPFEIRLHQMIRFWQNLQPTYAYSDSSKELYRQYSTPCPIGAIVAQYTGMDSAQKIFEPSAGNGLFLVGADPQKTHVNEIDASRRASLEFQGYARITRYNAAEAFPPEMTGTFDVVVTNPPFSKWEEEEFDKVRIVQKYFGGQVGLKQLRLEHLMAGLALETLQDEGRAAIIIMGHTYFDTNGYIAKYRGFFNWLYRHYYVDDVINLNGFKLYNKQGAIEKTMLILIRGRKQVPTGVAPLQNQAPWLDNVVDSFDQLWERVRPHIYYSTETIIQQLQIELIEV